jgi:tRNA1(Val) A37 N6-methylase TrmN6
VKPRILELGSGTGLLGLAAAAVWGANVVVTDLDIIQENLHFNVRQNHNLLSSRGANVTCDILDWTDLDNALPNTSGKTFEVSRTISLNAFVLLNILLRWF